MNNDSPPSATCAGSATAAAFEVVFESLFRAGRALTFPCDAQGQVDLETLPPRARDNYYFARTLIGRDFSMPRVCRAAPG